MKIVITSNGTTLQSEVDPRFARASYFIVYDVDNDSHEVVDNAQSADAVHGAGPQAAENISRTGAKVLITGNCGPNAFRVLGAAGIEVYTGFSGTVFEAINAFKKGELKKSSGASVKGHW
ncbi:MAG: NifB/NifX family molybdenum-iron cluster-binding protein [Candidatus Eremiobacteraeota bacterium]|nr:NifB/NifX family molybdenum-iron cluster-binding protein [Candidatus Eremiobacteraeota bacterium]